MKMLFFSAFLFQRLPIFIWCVVHSLILLLFFVLFFHFQFFAVIVLFISSISRLACEKALIRVAHVFPLLCRIYCTYNIVWRERELLINEANKDTFSSPIFFRRSIYSIHLYLPLYFIVSILCHTDTHAHTYIHRIISEW